MQLIPVFDSRNQPSTQNDPGQETDPTPTKHKFDEKTWKLLDGIDFKILDWLMYLSKLQSKRSGTGAAYCHPSEMWLAHKIGVRREAISRHVTKLHKLGVIDLIHRRKIRGVWQTNLYKVAQWFMWRLKAALAPLRAGNKPCAPKRTHSTRERVNPVSESAKGVPEAIKDSLISLFERVKKGERLDCG